MADQREVTIVLGQTGSGKTFWSSEFVRTHPRVLIADAGFDEFGVPSFPEYDGLLNYLDERKAFGTKRPFRAAYNFRPEEFALAFDTALRLGDTLLVLEEADRFSEVIRDVDNRIVYGGSADPDYRECLYRGRHYGVSLLLISLSPRAIPTEVRRQATRIVSFRQMFPTDVDWLSDVVGPEAEKLPTLPGPPARPPHPYLLWDHRAGARIVPPK